VRGFLVEIVGAIQIDREQVDGIEFIFLAVDLGLHQEHLFGQAIGALVSSGYPSHRWSSLNGSGVNLG